MRKFLFGVVLTLVVLFSFKYCGDKKEEKLSLHESTNLIQNQINNVGKLVVTEGHFSEVFTYKNSKAIFADLLNVEKKALVVVNANITISYDLSKIEYKIDEDSRILHIVGIPDEEIMIHPDFEYYDVQADYFNPFEAKDYNEIKEIVNKSLMKKIEFSDIKSNAKNRLISELAKFHILTNSLGWTLKYNDEEIDNMNQFSGFKL